MLFKFNATFNSTNKADSYSIQLQKDYMKVALYLLETTDIL